MNDIKMDANIKLLFVTQRLSDFIEMRRAAVSLKKYGYQCIMLFCGVDSPVHDNIVIQEIDKSISTGEFAEKIIFNQAPVNSSSKIQKLIGWFNFQLTENNYKALDESHKFLVKISKMISQYIDHYYIAIKNRILSVVTFISRKILFSFKRIFFSSYYSVPLSYKDNYQKFKHILKKNQINLIILPEDVVGKITPLLIKAGHSLKIPSMVLPYTICNQTEAFQALKERKELNIHSSLINRVLGILFRSWVMKDEKHAVLRLPAEYILGHIVTRSSPPDPWMMNSGYANVIAIENEKMFDYYRQSGIPAKKMKITGACYDDNLASYYLDRDNQKDQLYKKLNINSNKPLFLIGGFPNQIVGNPPGFDFKDAEDAVNFITQCIDRFKNEYEIIFRPHPNFLDLSKFFSKKGILVTEIDTAHLVALSDIYLAFASATIRWAICCGVPTINYDMFYYDFSDYKQVKGVLNACTKDEFKEAVDLMSNPESYTNLKKQLEIEKKEWGNLDGHSVGRINNLVTELVKHKKVRRKAS